jgi:hypothetical protein
MVPLHPIRWECFGSRAFIASLKIEEIVYFQGTSSIETILLTPLALRGSAALRHSVNGCPLGRVSYPEW